jgi:hypothetical protein
MGSGKYGRANTTQRDLHGSFDFALKEASNSDIVHAPTVEGLKACLIAFEPRILSVLVLSLGRLEVALKLVE